MIRSILMITMATCLGASASFAKVGFRALSGQMSVPPTIHLVQSDVDKLSDSELKRIKFYSGRVMKSLAEIAAEDAAGAVGSDASIVGLRSAISRLVDAGKRSGLSLTETADFFQLLTEDKQAHEFPLALHDASGKIDVQNLFAGVIGRSAFGTSGTSTKDYLTQLNAASATLAPLDGSAGSDGSLDQASQTGQKALGIQIPDGSDSATREILQRVEYRDGRWVIEVIPGDTLAIYAAALYGDPLAYRQIYQANRTILSSPTNIAVGTVLALPRGN